jgi:hypothetical protein
MLVAVNEPGRGSRPSQVATVETPAFQAGDFSLRTALKGGVSDRSRFYDETAWFLHGTQIASHGTGRFRATETS